MKLLCAFIVAALAAAAYAKKTTDPKVEVYTHLPGLMDVKNVLICHVSGFHPPDITIELLENGKGMPNVNQTDLSFDSDWSFRLTSSASFTPSADHQYSCRVTHHDKPSKTYVWESNV